MSTPTHSRTLHVVMAFDQGYLPGAIVTLASAIHNLAPGAFLDIVVLDCGLENPESINLGLQPLPKERFKIQVLPMDMDLIQNIPVVINRLSTSAFSVLKLQTLFPQLDRVLFLDADIIVNRDLSPLAGLDMQGCPIAAVQDPIAKVISYDIQNCETLGLDPQARYFNSGFVLFDLACWRRMDWESRLSQTIENSQIERTYNDQSFLNVTFSKKWLPLPRKWNRLIVLKPGHFPLCPLFPSVIHATWKFKPWQFSETGARGIIKKYYHYLRLTRFEFPDTALSTHSFSYLKKGELRRMIRFYLSEFGFDPWIYRFKALLRKALP